MTANGPARFGTDYPSHEMSGKEKALVHELNGSSPTSLLDPPETTSTNSSKWSYRGRFMAGKEQEYESTLEAYREIYKRESNPHVQALTGCRTYASLRRELTTGDVKVFGDSCRDRWCPMCAGQKSSYAQDQVKQYITSLKAPRFLTLTLKNNESDLKTQVSFLQQSFARLRTRAYWKKNVTGGVWFLEVKRGKNSEQWHPHLHILLDGNYMEHGRLSTLWELVTYGSPIIYIERISDFDHAAKYVSKYCAKPALLRFMPLEDRVEVIESLFRKRLCGTFGNAKSVTLTPPKVAADGDWNYIGHFDDIVERAEYCKTSRAILAAYNNEEPLPEDIFEKFTGHPPGNIPIVETKRKPNPQLLLDFYT